MAKIDRNSIDDAQKVVEKLMPDQKAREEVLSFLADAIIYANGLKPNNWNLNLNQSSQFIQFNVGYEFSTFIKKHRIGVLVLRDALKEMCNPQELGIEFRGSHVQESQNNWDHKYVSSDLDSTPDCLARVPGSVVCQSSHNQMAEVLSILEKPNRAFIHYAIHKTKLMPRMIKSHSPGLIAYLSKITGRQVPSPTHQITEQEFYQQQRKAEQKLKQCDPLELKEKIAQKVQTLPEQVTVVASKFKRDPLVATYAKLQANGICQDCLQPAPFENKLTNEPFLETHHIIPLAEGGLDTIENVIALCPNCHRKRHYG